MRVTGFGSIIGRIDSLIKGNPSLALEGMDLFKSWDLFRPKMGEYRVSTTFNISYLIPFAGEVDNKEEEPTNLRSNPLQGGEDDAILPRKGLVTKAMSKRL